MKSSNPASRVSFLWRTHATPASPSTTLPVSGLVFSQRTCASTSRTSPNRHRRRCPLRGRDHLRVRNQSVPVHALPVRDESTLARDPGHTRTRGHHLVAGRTRDRCPDPRGEATPAATARLVLARRRPNRAVARSPTVAPRACPGLGLGLCREHLRAGAAVLGHTARGVPARSAPGAAHLLARLLPLASEAGTGVTLGLSRRRAGIKGPGIRSRCRGQDPAHRRVVGRVRLAGVGVVRLTISK